MAKFDLGAFAQQLGGVSDSDTGLQMLPTDKLYANKRNFYPPVDEFDALVESIDANGLLEPLTVVADGNGRYRLISGHNRLKAVQELNGRSLGMDARWKELPCLVLPPMTEAQEQSAIIEGNRQRRKSSALLAEEAQKLTESYVARKQAGESLPGRIRQRVAEALQVSQTKLAVLNAIRENLKVPGFVRDWKEGRLSESVAYEISKLDQNAQYRLLDWSIEGNRLLSTVTVQRFKHMITMCRNDCPHGGGLCPNAEQMVLCKYYNGEFKCSGCCEQCLDKNTCATACEYIPRPEERAPDHSEVPEDPRTDWKYITEAFAARLKAAREDTGMDRKAFADKLGEFQATYSAWENGQMPGSSRIPKVALALGVSTDYLFGLTDNPTPMETAAFWRPLQEENWPEEGQLVLLSYENGIGGYQYQLARCMGGCDDLYPFVDPNNDLSCEDFDNFDHWLPLVGR